ncbi:hypothetical protein F5887DRAFT_126290 [Amanita rubescens]|nr:hypothetical protein F5887DRAFT_126290 [Amanita rubescens]
MLLERWLAELMLLAEPKYCLAGLSGRRIPSPFGNLDQSYRRETGAVVGLRCRSTNASEEFRRTPHRCGGAMMVATLVSDIIAQFRLPKLNHRHRILDGILFETGGVPRDKIRTKSPAVDNKLDKASYDIDLAQCFLFYFPFHRKSRKKL